MRGRSHGGLIKPQHSIGVANDVPYLPHCELLGPTELWGYLKRMRLSKISATGNDFILMDLLNSSQPTVADELRANLVRQWCNRHYGIGADGAVFIEAQPGYDFKWDFFNADGGSAEMCGNAARAVSLYMTTVQPQKKNWKFLTRAGDVHSQVESKHSIEVRLPPILQELWDLKTADRISYEFIRPGVPHAVVHLNDLKDQAAMAAMAKKIKAEAYFREQGTNVTFIAPVNDTSTESITYERGVEGFTLACGTGAIASAYCLARGPAKEWIEVRVPGGQLFVVWKDQNPILKGPAQITAHLDWLL
jgi:diaminopimelate epimerase